MKSLLKVISLLLAVIMLAAAPACSRGGEDGPDASEAPDYTRLTAEQSERAVRLAAAFDEFGEFDLDKGLTMAAAERMIYCYYRGILPESELKGFGRLTVDEALAGLAGIFKGIELPELIRTKYDASKEQELFILNGYYYLRLDAPDDLSYTLKSSEPISDEKSEAKLRAVVEVSEGGRTVREIILDLIPDDEWQFSAAGCGFRFAE